MQFNDEFRFFQENPTMTFVYRYIYKSVEQLKANVNSFSFTKKHFLYEKSDIYSIASYVLFNQHVCFVPKSQQEKNTLIHHTALQ